MAKLLLFLSLLSSCSRSGSYDFDRFVFHYTGGTLFSDPVMVSSKDVHLDSGHLIGRSVVFKGEVLKTGEYQSHLVLNDDFGKIIIVLTGIDDSRLETLRPGQKLRVLGVVERRSKGYPYINADSINY